MRKTVFAGALAIGLLALTPAVNKAGAQPIPMAEEQALDPGCLASEPSPGDGGATPEQIEEAWVLNASPTLSAVQHTAHEVAQYNGSPAGMAAARGQSDPDGVRAGFAAQFEDEEQALYALLPQLKYCSNKAIVRGEARRARMDYCSIAARLGLVDGAGGPWPTSQACLAAGSPYAPQPAAGT